jgi:hypothetical protein
MDMAVRFFFDAVASFKRERTVVDRRWAWQHAIGAAPANESDRIHRISLFLAFGLL